MRSVFKAVILAIGLCGCHQLPSDAGCDLPLSAYCTNDSRCPSYEASVAALRTYAASSSCFAAVIGTCGELRYTRRSDGFAGVTLYFGGGDRVVAAVTTSDAIVPNSACPGITYYGPRPACTAVVVEDLCRR